MPNVEAADAMIGDLLGAAAAVAGAGDGGGDAAPAQAGQAAATETTAEGSVVTTDDVGGEATAAKGEPAAAATETQAAAEPSKAAAFNRNADAIVADRQRKRLAAERQRLQQDQEALRTNSQRLNPVQQIAQRFEQMGVKPDRMGQVLDAIQSGDVVALIKATGMPVEKAYRGLTESLMPDKSPEAQKRRELAPILEEMLAPLHQSTAKADEVAQLKHTVGQLQQLINVDQMRRAEEGFINLVRGNDDVRSLEHFFENESEMVEKAHSVADALVTAGKKTTPLIVARHMLEQEMKRMTRFNERSKANTAASTATETTKSQAKTGQASGASDTQSTPRAITSRTANEVASGGRAKTRDEVIKEVDDDLARILRGEA